MLLYDYKHPMRLPMRYSREHKLETHARIVKKASVRLREKGAHGIGVADVMKEAGLTHGGFYAHFDSRDALLAAAAEQAAAESTETFSKALASAKRGEELMALVDTYLADNHVTAAERGLGCSIAAAGTEVPRQSPEVRRAVSRRIKDLIGLVERQFPDWGKPAAHEKAMAVGA